MKYFVRPVPGVEPDGRARAWEVGRVAASRSNTSLFVLVVGALWLVVLLIGIDSGRTGFVVCGALALLGLALVVYGQSRQKSRSRRR